MTFGRVNKLLHRSLASCEKDFLFDMLVGAVTEAKVLSTRTFNSTYLHTEESWTSTRSLTSTAINKCPASKSRDAMTERTCS